jgi:type IV pilus assembly protein PilM
MHLPSLNLSIGRRSEGDVVGLDIQPGVVAAVHAQVNGAILAERAAVMPLPSDTVREGDVVDQDVLSEVLRELFATSRLSKRVRVGVANQRTVMRTLELPPLEDAKELAAAVRFQAQDQVPMPLANAVLDFHPLGIVDTPAGPRQKVVLVAAQRDMIERLLGAVRGAGLNPVGVDLSAFALIRSLYRGDPEHAGRVLYLNVDGLTNVAIAEGTVCRFTRVLGGGLEEMAAELAERRGIPLTEARTMLASVDLREPAAPHDEAHEAEREHDTTTALDVEDVVSEHGVESEPPDDADAGDENDDDLTDDDLPEPEPWMNEARSVLENGVRAISGDVRNSLDFHRTQEGGGDVERVVLSGSALELPGFAETLESALGVVVSGEAVGLVDPSLADGISPNRLAVATGLAAKEVPQ